MKKPSEISRGKQNNWAGVPVFQIQYRKRQTESLKHLLEEEVN